MSKKNKIVVTLSAVIAVALGTMYMAVIKPRLELQELARETCDELEGASFLIAASIINNATGKTEQLGFETVDLRDAMFDECPYILDALEKVG